MIDPVSARKCVKRNDKQVLILENTETKYVSLIMSGHQNWKKHGNYILLPVYNCMSCLYVLENIYTH